MRRPTPVSLLFVADRLLDEEGEQAALGRILRNEVAMRAVAPTRIKHVLFTMSGNAATATQSHRLRRSADPITAARDFVAMRGIPSDPDAIRLCRQELLASTDESLRQPTLAPDLYGLSTCRDLLFHVQETLMTLPEIAAFLTEQRLTFLGFELESSVAAALLFENPQSGSMMNLKAWHDFEVRHPNAFYGMYQFWVQSQA